jgi:hypothetical protein
MSVVCVFSITPPPRPTHGALDASSSSRSGSASVASHSAANPCLVVAA